MRYNIHIYATVRVKIEDVEANSQLEAIQKARDSVDLYHLLNGKSFEFAEEVTSYLVDEQGDEDYSRTRDYPAGDTDAIADVLVRLKSLSQSTIGSPGNSCDTTGESGVPTT